MVRMMVRIWLRAKKPVNALQATRPDFFHKRHRTFFENCFWCHATFVGLCAFYAAWVKSDEVVEFLPFFISFNFIHIAKSFLSYTKTMILTWIVFFLNMIILQFSDDGTPMEDVIEFNWAFMGIFVYAAIVAISTFLFAEVCLDFRMVELRKRLNADKSLEELIFNEAMVSRRCADTFGGLFASFTCGLWFFEALKPEANLDLWTMFFVYLFLAGTIIFGFITMYRAIDTMSYFMKARALKAPKKVEEVSQAVA